VFVKLRLMFEWGGGCLWANDDASIAAFGVGPIESKLFLLPDTCSQLVQMSSWHDTSRDWDNVHRLQDPTPWSIQEQIRFERAVDEMQSMLRAELGPEFEVEYLPL
jgi:hypothetical protein